MRRHVSSLTTLGLGFALWAHSSAAQIPTPPEGDGGVGQPDYSLFLTRFGQTPGP